ncbi:MULTISPECIES: sulfurtransferase complex subunit TusB [Pseudomonas syringae group]|uniref:DsrH family protein n=4 Tax=Pseudomonas syringae group TaxID=136849 RepID=A0AA40TW44_9PSED|nr:MULTISPECIES: sulfurtransferase complex subunit TusB [Pseudomonas syringae group]KOP51487.1 sulfur relay protein DsrH [Pseudomonas coronafaciens pv. porri]KOP58267.1 sulfur relay protein DsrH [Pseudomonas coronafaciens pv. porri]KPB50010.1 DsrH family protein [Pseudomonas coronafaciens pv. oryzae]KPW34957.1 DsrH family protein [Pseudomonas coronafaciens pv. atropurpurea]KPX29083.1 DsrH family protein [Pseudomonas coronafaciens pv. garcae]
MATLHVLSHSPFADTRLDSCLRVLGNDDGVLLCGDATYALTPSSAPLNALQAVIGSLKLFALDEDIKARNLSLPAGVSSVDYPTFVQLSLRFDKVNTWL